MSCDSRSLQQLSTAVFTDFFNEVVIADNQRGARRLGAELARIEAIRTAELHEFLLQSVDQKVKREFLVRATKIFALQDVLELEVGKRRTKKSKASFGSRGLQTLIAEKMGAQTIAGGLYEQLTKTPPGCFGFDLVRQTFAAVDEAAAVPHAGDSMSAAHMLTMSLNVLQILLALMFSHSTDGGDGGWWRGGAAERGRATSAIF